MSQNKKRYNLIKTITSSKIYTVLKSINSDEILKLINYQDNSQFIIDLINNSPKKYIKDVYKEIRMAMSLGKNKN